MVVLLIAVYCYRAIQTYLSVRNATNATRAKLNENIKNHFKQTELFCKDDSEWTSVIENFPCFQSKYNPTLWCFPSASNSIAGALLQRVVKVDYQRFVFQQIRSHYGSWIVNH